MRRMPPTSSSAEHLRSRGRTLPARASRRRDATHQAASCGATLTAANAAMGRYVGGDGRAFTVVYDALAPRLRRFLVRSTHDAARAEDLLQQTFLRMHCARERFVPGASVVVWAFAIARRLHVDELRRAARQLSTAEHGGAAPTSMLRPDQLIEARCAAEEIHEMVAKLPENQRLAFELVKWNGLSLTDAADALGITVPAVKALTHRAYRALRDGLEATSSRRPCAVEGIGVRESLTTHARHGTRSVTLSTKAVSDRETRSVVRRIPQ